MLEHAIELLFIHIFVNSQPETKSPLNSVPFFTISVIRIVSGYFTIAQAITKITLLSIKTIIGSIIMVLGYEMFTSPSYMFN